MTLKIDEYLYTQASRLHPTVLVKYIAVTLFLRKGQFADGTLTESELEGLRELVALIYPDQKSKVSDPVVQLHGHYAELCGNYRHCLFDPLAKHNLLNRGESTISILTDDDEGVGHVRELVYYVDSLLDNRDDVGECLAIVNKLEELGL
jgi:hypothetical protein